MKTDYKKMKTGTGIKGPINKALDVIGRGDSYPSSFYPKSAGRILPLLNDIAKITPGRVLDVGCGVGLMASVIAQLGFESHCLDAYKNIDEKVIRTFNLRFLECNVELSPIPYDSNSFDVVILSEVLEHFHANPLVPLKEIYRILKPEGLLFLTTPNVASIFSFYTLLRGDNVSTSIETVLHGGGRHPEGQGLRLYDMHFRCYTIKEIRYLMSEVGFSIIKYKSLVRGEPSTRKFPRKLFLLLARRIAALTNSRLWGETIYIIAKKTASNTDMSC
ncbi:MAG TPA: class I SAM-dependent methyltransferase [Dehalococcoidales bacterium]